MRDFENLVGSIYDCAANPALWPKTLEEIRLSLDAAFVIMGFIDASQIANGGRVHTVYRHSDWDKAWLEKMIEMMASVPKGDTVYFSGIDTAWTQMTLVTEADFQKSPFYEHWAKPQRLRDSIAAPFLSRDGMNGLISAPSFIKRELYSDRDVVLVETLTPHIRRAILINDIVDKGNLALSLYRKVLDTLSVAVCVVGAGSKLVYANTRADELLKSGDLLRLVDAKLTTTRPDITGAKLENALARAIKGDAALGIAGIGVPLASLTGERAAAYVLPIAGNDLRGQIGPGLATVFIARRGEQQPMAIEILRTVFDLTPVEAKIAYATSLGNTPEAISLALGKSINTVRSHLKNIYPKVDVPDKTALAARINAMIPPVDSK